LLKTPKTDPPKRHSSEATPRSRTFTVNKNEASASRRTSELTPKNKVLNGKSKGSNGTPECYKPIYIGTPMSFTKSRKSSDGINFEDVRSGEEDSSVIVAIRIRQFSYDHCFWSADRLHLQYADQKKVYETIAQPLLDKAFQGYNTCLFAYGQTG